MDNKDRFDSNISYDRDFRYDYFGFKTLTRSYLMKLNGKIVGYAFITIIKFEIHLNRIAIDPNYQKNGFGLQLLTKILEETSNNK